MLTHPRPAIARFWKRSDGAACLLYKHEDGWCLTIEKDGEPLKTLLVPGPTEAIQTAKQWRSAKNDEVAS